MLRLPHDGVGHQGPSLLQNMILANLVHTGTRLSVSSTTGVKLVLRVGGDRAEKDCALSADSI